MMPRPDVIPIPLRENVVAHVHIPLDLTMAEADKIARVIKTYAVDAPVEGKTISSIGGGR